LPEKIMTDLFSLKNDILQWDVASWSVVLEYWENKVEWSKINLGLELGARNGGLSLWMSLKGVNVICSDLHNPKVFAEQLHKKYKVNHKITYQSIDATDIPYSHHFDIIVLKSVLGGVGRDNRLDLQAKVFHQIHKALRPGGIFLFAENLRASPLHQWARKNFVKWGKEWRYMSISELKELLNPFLLYDIQVAGVMATFGRTERQRQILSKLDKYLLNHICPNAWKYIAYGMAVK